MAIPSGALVPVMKIEAAPAVPFGLTGIWMIWWNAVLATYITVPALLNSTPFAPNGGVRPVPGPSEGLLLQIVRVPPLGPVFQMMPLDEAETETFPSLSKVSALTPAPPI